MSSWIRQRPPSTIAGLVGSRSITSLPPLATIGSTEAAWPRFLELMKVISFSIDQISSEGWLRSARTQPLSCSYQLSNSFWSDRPLR